MADVFVRLLKAYRRHGFQVRTGLNPLYFGDADSPFTHFRNAAGVPMSVGGGLAPQELHFLQCLFESRCQPTNVLVIGNAFGWSALALGCLLPRAAVVAIDAALEGTATDEGASLTRAIAAEEGVSVRVVGALSPRDIRNVVATEFGGAPLDFVLIDGYHTNEQLARDFDGVAPHASKDCIFLFHDVLHWHMVNAFGGLTIPVAHERRILTRSPSGMGIVFPAQLDASARDAIEAFCDETVDVAAWQSTLGATADTPGVRLSARLSRGWRLRRLGMAATYEAEGHSGRAREEIALALAENADDADAQFEIAAHLIDRGHWQDAEVALRRARALAPTWEAPSQQLGRVLCALERYDEAQAVIADAIEQRPAWAIPHFDLGLVVQRLRGGEPALVHFERAASLDPAWAAPHCERGAIYFRAGDDDRAVEALELATSLDPASVAAHHVLGLSKGRRDGYVAAVPALERAAALDPDSAYVRYDLGVAHFHLAHFADARGHFAHAVAHVPDWSAAHHLLGLATWRIEGARAALPALERAAALDPNAVFVLFDLAAAASSVGDDTRARTLLARVVDRAPDWESGWREAGACAKRLGRWADAASCFERAADIGRADERLRADLIEALLCAGEWRKVVETCRACHAVSPAARGLAKDVAIELRTLGRLRESETVLLDALAVEPDWAGAQFELGRTCEALGDWARAEVSLRRAVDLRPNWAAARAALDRLLDTVAERTESAPLAG